MESKKGLTRTDLNQTLFSEILSGINKDAILKSWVPFSVKESMGYITSSYSKESDDQNQKVVGVYFFKLEYLLPKTDKTFFMNVVIKSKMHGEELLDSLTKSFPNDASRQIFRKVNEIQQYGLPRFHDKELDIVSCGDKDIQSIMPKIYWSCKNDEKGVYAFAMEYLDPNLCKHLNSAEDISGWTEHDVTCVLKDVSILHNRFYDKTNELPVKIKNHADVPIDIALSSLKECFEHNKVYFSDFFQREFCDLIYILFVNLKEIYDVLCDSPKTLIHADMTVTNLCLSKHQDQQPKLCVYDWECYFLGPPERDIAVFLASVLSEDCNVAKFQNYAGIYWENMIETTRNEGRYARSREEFMRMFDMCMCDVYITYCTMIYLVIATRSDTKWLPRVITNSFRYVQYVVKKYNFNS